MLLHLLMIMKHFGFLLISFFVASSSTLALSEDITILNLTSGYADFIPRNEDGFHGQADRLKRQLDEYLNQTWSSQHAFLSFFSPLSRTRPELFYDKVGFADPDDMYELPLGDRAYVGYSKTDGLELHQFFKVRDEWVKAFAHEGFSKNIAFLLRPGLPPFYEAQSLARFFAIGALTQSETLAAFLDEMSKTKEGVKLVRDLLHDGISIIPDKLSPEVAADLDQLKTINAALSKIFPLQAFKISSKLAIGRACDSTLSSLRRLRDSLAQIGKGDETIPE